MPHRVSQVQSILLHDLALDLHELLQGDEGLVTVSHVEVQPDLKSANVWISVSDRSFEKSILDLANQHRTKLQNQVSRRHKFKFTPILHFKIDRGQKSTEHVNRLLEKL